MIQHQIAIDLWRGHANMIKFSNICYVECEPVELNSQRSNISTCTHKYKWADAAVEPKVQRKLKKTVTKPTNEGTVTVSLDSRFFSREDNLEIQIGQSSYILLA